MNGVTRHLAIAQVLALLLALSWWEPAGAVFRVWDPVNFSFDWHTAANWDPNGVPTTNDTVQVSNAGIAPILSANTAAINSLLITRNTVRTNGHTLVVEDGGNGLLTVNGILGDAGLRVDSTGSSTSALVADDVLIQGDGTLTLRTGDVFTEVGQEMTIGVGGIFRTSGAGDKVVTFFSNDTGSTALVNDGLIDIQGGEATFISSTFDSMVLGGSTNSGEVRVASGASLTVNGAVPNFQGVINIGSGDALATLDIQTLIGTWTNNGQINLDNGEVTGVSLTNTGTISGHGSITADNLINFTTLSADGGMLVINTPVQPDFDGPTGSGIVNALTGDLDLSPLPGATLFYPGSLNVGGGHQASMGDRSFLLQNGSLVNLSGGILTARFFNFLFGSTLQVDCCDESRIDHGMPGDPNVPSRFSGNVQLDGALRITGKWVIGASSAFTGNGQLIVDEAESLYLPDSTDFGTSLRNEGILLLDDFDMITIHQVDLGANFTQTTTGVLPIDVAGVVPGQFDMLAVEGNIDLDGALEVRLNENFEPNLGNTFTILTSEFGSVEGEFAAENVPVFDGLTFDVIYDPNSVVLEVVEAGIPGDFDFDGDVDGFDFLVWQQGGSPIALSQSDLSDWETNYGMSAPLLAASAATVPEPSTLLLGMLASIGLMLHRRCLAR